MSSLLESFGILFESDSDEAKKGADEAGKATEDLEKKIVKTDKATEDLGGSFLDLIGSAKGALAAVLSVGALAAGAVATAEMTDELGKFSDRLGLNVGDVNAWTEAVIRSGGDAGGFRASVEGLTRGLTDFAITGGGTAADTFAKIGISATDASGKVKSAFEVLPELADAFQGLSRAESAGLGDRLGLDQSTILLLQQGRQAVEDLVNRQRALGVVTEEDAKIAADFNDQWADTRQVFRSLSVTSGSTILPLFTMILKGVENIVFFLADHEGLVTGFFIGISAVILGVYGPAIGAAAVATLATIAPFILIGAVIAAAGLAIGVIVDDIYNFIQGNDSLIGNIAEKYPAIGRLVSGIGDAIGFVVDTAASLGTALVEAFGGKGAGALDILAFVIDKMFESLNAILGLVFGLGDAFFTAFTSPQKALEILIDTFKTFASGLSDFLPDIGGILDTFSNLLGFGSVDSNVEQNIKTANEVLNNINSNPLNGQTSNSINTANQSNRVSNVMVKEVNVNTQATDAQGMAQAAGGALSEQMAAAVNNIDDGVAY